MRDPCALPLSTSVHLMIQDNTFYIIAVKLECGQLLICWVNSAKFMVLRIGLHVFMRKIDFKLSLVISFVSKLGV